MKTNAVSETLSNKRTPVLKTVTVNPALSPFRKQQADKALSIQGYELRRWLEHLNDSDGVYFLDGNKGKHSLHYKHHSTGRLMELQQEGSGDKERLEALLFDLSLFGNTPILAFDANKVANELYTRGAIYYEHAKEIDDVVGRLVEVDMKNLFTCGIYNEPRVRQLSIDGIYQAFFPGTSRTFKEEGSYALYMVYMAIQSIFSQIIDRTAIAKA